jgi:hypothetical protein
MRRNRIASLLIAVAATLAIGLPYWATRYRQLNLPTALLGADPWIVAIATATVVWVGRSQPGAVRRALIVGSAMMPTVVLARIVFDVVREPTTHNLWLFEIAIAGTLGFACAACGAAAAWLLTRLIRTAPDGAKPRPIRPNDGI